MRGLSLGKIFPYLLLVGGTIGIACSGILTVEKIHLIQNPQAQLACDINPVVACGPVINTAQASAFGFPNPLIGLAGFAVVATIGAALLAGAAFKRWFWIGLQIGVLFGVCFVSWLQFQTIFRIHALCPFCMVVWAVMIPLFWYTTLYNIRQGNLPFVARHQRFSAFLQHHHGDILVSWLLILAGIIAHQFWYYWKTLLP